MIRVALPDGWLLLDHRDHARLAGEFAAHWGNAEFATPEPRDDILAAVARHDDAWIERDASPFLTREGRPSAFSRELVGSYTAFEEIDLEDYLRVRSRAAEVVAGENVYAAIIVSMHTVNLLTENADASKLTTHQREQHAQFLAAQYARQQQWVAELAQDRSRMADIEPLRLQRAFEFLQACDSLSLLACADYPTPRPLRHTHPRRDGRLETLLCTPLGRRHFRVNPWPFDQPELRCTVPARTIAGTTFSNLESFRAAHAAAAMAALPVVLTR